MQKFENGGIFMAIKVTLGWVGFKKSYVINRVGQAKILCLLTRWVGGSKKGQKYAYVIYEWSLVLEITSLKVYNRFYSTQGHFLSGSCFLQHENP